MKKMNKKGFTLIEMLVVIAIIAVLVSIVVPTVSAATKKAQAATDAANLRSLAAEAAIDYLDDNDLDNTYTATSKLLSGASVEIHKDANGNINAVFVSDNKYYDVNSFSTVASEGKDIVAATGYSATTKLYPAAANNNQQQ